MFCIQRSHRACIAASSGNGSNAGAASRRDPSKCTSGMGRSFHIKPLSRTILKRSKPAISFVYQDGLRLTANRPWQSRTNSQREAPRMGAFLVQYNSRNKLFFANPHQDPLLDSINPWQNHPLTDLHFYPCYQYLIDESPHLKSASNE